MMLQKLSNKTTTIPQQQLQPNVTLDVITKKLMKDNEKCIIENCERQQIKDELLNRQQTTQAQSDRICDEDTELCDIIEEFSIKNRIPKAPAQQTLPIFF